MFKDGTALLSHYFGSETVDDIDTLTDGLVKVWEPHPTSDKVVAAMWFSRTVVMMPEAFWSAHIVLLAVACPFRRKGYATRMLQEVMRGYHKLSLNVELDNRAAILLYYLNGFRPVTLDYDMYDGRGGWYMEWTNPTLKPFGSKIS